ncbi:Sec-independent protein translocase TatB [Streptomyces sp. NPDC002133]|uniref:Sec-independent protein translocase TatB n=1 Tax=Streptomyces sp. NPDC002133 TaxID=3154409 RepID=UPI00331A498B
MFFDTGPLEILTLFVIAIVVLGPEKLPKAISETTALIRKVRALSDSAQADIRQELGPEFADLHLRDLHPRALAEKTLAKAEDETGLREITQSLNLNQPANNDDADHPERSLAHGTHALSKQPRA